MNEYQCLDPSIQQVDWTRVIAATPQRAAEEYAKGEHEGSSGESDDTIPVWVKDAAGNETRWLVTREWEPTFTAEPET